MYDKVLGMKGRGYRGTDGDRYIYTPQQKFIIYHNNVIHIYIYILDFAFILCYTLSMTCVKRKYGYKIKLEENGRLLPKLYKTLKLCQNRIKQMEAHK